MIKAKTDLYWSMRWQIGKSLDVHESHLSLQPILLDKDSLTQAVKLYDGFGLQGLHVVILIGAAY